MRLMTWGALSISPYLLDLSHRGSAEFGGAGCPFICKMLSTFQDPWAVYIVLERVGTDK